MRNPESSASVLSPVKADLLKYYQKHGLENIAKEVNFGVYSCLCWFKLRISLCDAMKLKFSLFRVEMGMLWGETKIKFGEYGEGASEFFLYYLFSSKNFIQLEKFEISLLKYI